MSPFAITSCHEDGLNMLLHRIRCDRRGVELVSNLHIAFVPRHAIGRLHERSNELSGWGFGAAFMLVGVLGFITRNSEAHIESALHLLCQDVLLVGTSRPALKRASNGENYDNTLFEVRTALPADEVKSRDALEQGRLAASAAITWLKERPHDPGPLLATIPAMVWHGGDFTSKVAVKG